MHPLELISFASLRFSGAWPSVRTNTGEVHRHDSRGRRKSMFALFLLGGAFPAAGSNLETPISVQPLTSQYQLVLTAATLGILVNLNDPDLVELGKRYAEIRGIPSENIIGLKLPNVSYVARHLMVRELDRLKASTNYDRFAGFALAFDRPYRVDANQSITSAISQGISTMRWHGNCNPTAKNPDAGKGPGAVLSMKPAMMLTAGGGLVEGVALAKRGREADGNGSPGQIVFLKTGDMARSRPREASMERAQRSLGGQIEIKLTEQREPWSDLMGLQTGLAVVPSLNELQFLPGAFADHLTSYGGVIDGKNSQMPATEWIRAGATASFGTVREPCNFPTKFPDPARLLSNYLGGDTILEAYWKSVSMMTEGLFIGEPLARPFPLMDGAVVDRRLELRANRQTEAFLKRQLRKGSLKHAGKQIKLGFFWVETGIPEWITDIELAGPLKIGSVLATIELPRNQVNSRSIGVLVRK